MAKKTVYFKDVTSFFLGGGVGGFAHAGAVLAAESRGCRFRAAAGTSFGAITAAFVAAGFRGRDLVATIRKIPLSDLIGSRARAAIPDAGCGSRIGDAAPSQRPGPLIEPGAARGLYSSEGIQHWVNNQLRERLGIRRSIVTFSDLRWPLVVLAADLRGGRAKTWSRATDPDMPVGLAVRCSCNIPFLFHPVDHERHLLVDGSILANQAADEIITEKLEGCALLPVLAFHLARPEFQDLGEDCESERILHRLADIVVSGHATTRMSQGSPAQHIEIPVGGVAPTDFSLSRPAVTTLIRFGFDAAASFLENETVRVAESGYLTRRLEMSSQPNLVDQTMIQLRSARQNVFISGGDLSWAWELYPVLTLKAIEGVSIRILSPKSIDPVLALTLGRIGCEVRRAAVDLMVYGAFIDPGEPDGLAILIELQNGRLRGGNIVANSRGTGVLAALMDRFELLWQQAVPQNVRVQPEFHAVESRVVEGSLRERVRQYRESEFISRPIAVNDVLPLTRHLEVARLRRAEAVVDLYERMGWTPFVPMLVRESTWFLAPPVVEIVDGRFVLIDGTHRIYHCRNRGVATVWAILVRNASEPPPARVFQGWDGALPLPYHLRRGERYEQYDESRWRDIRSAWEDVAHQSLPARPSS